VIEPARIAAIKDDSSAIRYMRMRTELLARRSPNSAHEATATTPVAAAISPDELAEEIGRLPAQCLLEETRELQVFLAEAAQIPGILNEIGRLREVTFRAVGEGSGAARDLDAFDAHYMHLFVWNREARELIGAYRMGDVPRILARFGRRGLYTDSLFRFRPGFLEQLGPALEMGRSFIRPEYQRQFAPLLLLWKGIGVYVARRPECAILIGAVSVSNQYSPASRQLIARYFQANRSGASDVKPRRPLRGNFIEKWEMQALCSLLPDVEELSGSVADLEADGKGIPILVKQYIKLGGQMMAFSVDPHFGNTLDGFVMVDLRNTAPDILSRYMGRDGARSFRAWHDTITPRVA
jgi:putative hemolysin